MKKKRLGAFLVLGLAGLVFVAQASATLPLPFTDTYTKGGFDIQCVLKITPGDGNYDFDAVLAMNKNSTSSDARPAGWTGSYVTGLESDPAANLDKGVTARGTSEAIFKVSFSGDDTSNNLFMPSKAAHRDGSAGQSPTVKLGRLSEDLTKPVPEPATMLLLGFGLLWLGSLGRKVKK